MSSRLLPDIVSVTPTAFEAWRRCPRLYYLGSLLGLPASDPGPSADEGLLVHELLRLINQRGRADDEDHVASVLESHGADDPHYRDLVARHARRTPTEFERAAHEVDIARFHRGTAPIFMATARIDAIWIHDGLLDARDYKTGAVFTERVADDPRALVQAWILDTYATRRGLRLRLRYEYLAAEVAEDPVPWDPEPEDIERARDELHSFVVDVWRRNDADTWSGINETDVCRTCRFRSICVDSAAPAEPAWPALSTASEDSGDSSNAAPPA